MPTLTDPSTLSVPTLPWQEFLDNFRWEQGEHLTAIGPTKSGKTTLIQELLDKAYRDGTHPWQAVAATKPMDEVVDAFVPRGFHRLPEWVVADANITPRVLIHPKLTSLGERDKELQRKVLHHMNNAIFRQHGWLVYYDELKWCIGQLKLNGDIETLWHTGRSSGVTVVSSLQRPRHVPLMAYDQSDHLFFWEARDADMRKRLSEIGGKADPDTIVEAVHNLGRHDFIYVSPSTGEITHSEVEL